MVLDFEKEKLIRELKKRKPKRVLIQLAEGIKQNSSEFADLFNKMGIEAIFSGETSWGACSPAIQEAEALGADLIVHFGHAEFMKINFPIVYVEVKDILDLNPLLEKSLKALKKYRKIGFSYSVQHRHDIEKIKEFYESHGKEFLLSKRLGHVAYEGHIVGCQYAGLKAIENDVDCFVILGNQFHGMGAVLSVDKPVILLDVYNNDVRELSGLRNKILKQRAIAIEKFRQAKDIGIIMEIKPGQKFGSPKYLVEKLKELGKNPVLITMNELSPDKIMNFYNVDAFIVLACPRIPIDDYAKYPRTLITFKEALVGLGIKSWEEILKIGIV
ncbi:MAG TPA: diphthamide biosynthesis enzyme Dph2 [Candidatus Omnitrophota bacterium]|nr:diphthamide biosynthesis enzyme Dph2 [Candidatus Omnitrophota bacterium]